MPEKPEEPAARAAHVVPPHEAVEQELHDRDIDVVAEHQVSLVRRLEMPNRGSRR